MRRSLAAWPFRSWLVAAALVVGCGGAVASAYNTHETAMDARDTAIQLKRAICTLRDERVASVVQLRGNLDRSLEFLHRHPDGSGDITRSDIQASIDGIRAQIRLQRGTIRAFRYAACP